MCNRLLKFKNLFLTLAMTWMTYRGWWKVWWVIFHEICFGGVSCVVVFAFVIFCSVSSLFPTLCPKAVSLMKESKFSIQDFFFFHLLQRTKKEKVSFSCSPEEGDIVVIIINGPAVPFIYVASFKQKKKKIILIVMLSFFVSGWEDRYAWRKTGQTLYLMMCVCVCVFIHYIHILILYDKPYLYK